MWRRKPNGNKLIGVTDPRKDKALEIEGAVKANEVMRLQTEHQITIGKNMLGDFPNTQALTYVCACAYIYTCKSSNLSYSLGQLNDTREKDF